MASLCYNSVILGAPEVPLQSHTLPTGAENSEPNPGESWSQHAMLVTLSGIDGSGKSSHGAELLRAFADRNVSAIGMTARIGSRTPVRVILEAVRTRRRKRGSSTAPSPRAMADAHWRGWRLTIWSVITALDYAIWLQHLRWKLWQRQVVIADRYLFDFAVEFSILVKSQPRLRSALVTALRWIAPKPDRSYYLRIEPQLSRERKPEDQHGYNHDDVCFWYDRLYADFGARLFDNSRAFEHVSAAIVGDVLSAYQGSPRSNTA